MEIKVQGEDIEMIEKILGRMNVVFGIGVNYFVEVRCGILRYVGFGFIIQFSLVVGIVVVRFNGIYVLIGEFVRVFGRGKNSGVGIYIFVYGGFVLDGGVRNFVLLLVFCEDFLEEWVFFLVILEFKCGLDEEEEKFVMELSFGDVEVVREISYRILFGFLLIFKECNIKVFGEYLSVIQKFVGRYFVGFQGGEFREDIFLIVKFFNEKMYGVGQSSWGFIVYGLILKLEFQSVSSEVFDYLKDQGIKVKIELGILRNIGVEIVEENVFLIRIIKSVVGGQ